MRRINSDAKAVLGPLDSMFRRCVGAGRGSDSVQGLYELDPEESKQPAVLHYRCKAKDQGKIVLHVENLKPGSYRVSVYRVVYRVNDPYADYLDMARPGQLTRPQVENIRKRHDVAPVSEDKITVRRGEALTREYALRENDVYLVSIEPSK